jgi:hypothetical protein
MKSTKTMLFGIILMLLGVGLIQTGSDQYLTQMFPVLKGIVITTVFPLASLGLILVGAIVATVGIFIRRETRLFG